MPKTSFITISQKIENKEKRQELINITKNCIPKEVGAIVRTSAEKASKEDIKKDIEILLSKWKEIEDNFKKSPNEAKLIWESENIIEKMITDLSEKKLERITTNSEEEYKKLKKIAYIEKIEIILDKKNDILSKYDLEKQIQKLENRRIWLNCGGFITIDKTEALTAIDVNTGKFTGSKDLESTIFKVNKEATIEIAKQLRLRDIGGIIVID